MEKQIAGYLLHQRLAVGGMAEVYRAERTGPGAFSKTVALKVVLPHLADDPTFVAMFLQEAQLAAQLNSANLVSVFDFGEDNGNYYLAMEYVDGVDLARLLRRHGPLPLDVAVFVMRQICSALGDLHQATNAEGNPLQIVHRDINPQNILLSKHGRVKIGDFGIAKPRANALRTEPGLLKGKLAYLSPEQARGETLDGRSDLYGAGLIFFECLTGQPYLSAQSDVQWLTAAKDPPLRKATSVRPELPAWVDQVLQRALAPEPGRRYANAELLERAVAHGSLDGTRGNLEKSLGALVCSAQSDGAKAPTPPSVATPVPAPVIGNTRPGTEVLPQDRKKTTMPIALAAMALFGTGVAVFVSLSDGPQTSAPRTPAPRRNIEIPVQRTVASDAALVSLPDIGAEKTPSKQAMRHRAPARTMHRNQRASADAPPTTTPSSRTLDSHIANPSSVPDSPVPAPVFDSRAPNSAAGTISIDRTTIESRIQSLNQRIAGAKIPRAVEKQLHQRVQNALSYAVTGRYREANDELNAIETMLSR